VSRFLRALGRRARFALLASVLLLLAGPQSGRAGVLSVSDIQLLQIDSRSGGGPSIWAFVVEIAGAGISSATLSPPGGAPILLDGDSTIRGRRWDFASLAELQAMFGPSSASEKYVVEVNGTETVSLDFAPVQPNGRATLTNPVPDSAVTDTMPVFSISNACSNCGVQFVGVTDDLYYDYAIQLESFVFGPPFPATLMLSDFVNQGSGGPVSELPEGPYEVCSVAAVGDISTQMFDGGSSFEYTAAWLAENCVVFAVVPVPQVDEVQLGIREGEVSPGVKGWFFEAFVAGASLSDGRLVLPSSAEVAFAVEDFGLSYASSAFASVGALQAVFPPSEPGNPYVLFVNTDVAQASLEYDPPVPDSAMTISQPVDGASEVSPTPTLELSQSCTNCNLQWVELFDEASAGEEILYQFAQAPPFSSGIAFSELGANLGSAGPLAELPDRAYRLVAETVNEQMSQQSFTPPDDFVFYAGAFRQDEIRFTVPEVSSGAALCGLATLGLLARRRRPGGEALRYPGS